MIALTAVAVTAATAVSFLRTRTEPADPSAMRPTAAQVDAAPLAASLVAMPPRHYQATLRSVATLEGTDGTFLDLEATGHLDLQGIGGAKRAVALRFEGRFSELAGAAIEQMPESTRDELNHQLESPFFAEYAESGSFSALRVTANQSEFVLQVQRFIAAVLQRSEQTKSDAWEATEEDASGKYLATYQRCGEGCLRRKKLRYTEREKNRAAVEVKQSETTFRFDSSELTEVSCHDVLRTSGLGAMAFIVETTFTLRAPGAVATALPALDDDLETLRADEQRSHLSRDEMMIGGRSVGNVMAKLAAFKKARAKAPLDDDDKAAEGREYLALKGLLRRDASAVAAVRDHVLSRGPLSDDYIAALRDAGNPESQRALREVMTARNLEMPTRFEATRALSLVGHPDAESVTALQAARADSDLRQQAVYGLGSAAYRSQGADPGLANRALGTLLEMLQSETDPYRRATLLKALGNAGMAEALPAIEQCLAADSPIVRAAAAESLRRISGPVSDGLLLRLLGDPSDRVRSEAVRALEEHGPSATVLPALANVAQNEPDSGVRTQAVVALIAWARDGGPTTGLLEQIARTDPDPRIRELAAGVLPALAQR